MSNNVTIFVFFSSVKLSTIMIFSNRYSGTGRIMSYFSLTKTFETVNTVGLYECDSHLFLNRVMNITKLTFPDYFGSIITRAGGYLWLYATDFTSQKNNKLKHILPYICSKNNIFCKFLMLLSWILKYEQNKELNQKSAS